MQNWKTQSCQCNYVIYRRRFGEIPTLLVSSCLDTHRNQATVANNTQSTQVASSLQASDLAHHDSNITADQPKGVGYQYVSSLAM